MASPEETPIEIPCHLHHTKNKKLKHILLSMRDLMVDTISSDSALNFEQEVLDQDRIELKKAFMKAERMMDNLLPSDPIRDPEIENKYLRKRVVKLEKDMAYWKHQALSWQSKLLDYDQWVRENYKEFFGKKKGDNNEKL